MDKRKFGKRLNQARKQRGLTSEALAEKCDVTPVFVRQIESGARLPGLALLVEMCNALRVSPQFLLMDSLESNEQTQLDDLSALIAKLTPKQIDIVSATITTMAEKMDEE